MSKLFLIFFLVSSFIFANEKPTGSLYLEAQSSNALILAHGKGKGPTYKVVNPLRLSINKDLDFHTLSLQMPNQKEDFKAYASEFPKAYEIINEAITFLQSKGVQNIYLLGHSMGSRMVSSYMANHPHANIKGLIILGCRNGGGEPFNCKANVKNLALPILDMWGSDNDKDSSSAKDREDLISKVYKQVQINGANHRFDAREDELVKEVESWLKSFKL